MKRSRSGTRSQRGKGRARHALGLLLAVLAVAAFLTSFILGLNRDGEDPPRQQRADTTQPLVVPDSRVRVQVLNGSRRAGLARQATDILRDAGYDVVSLGNARNRRDESVVFDRVGQPEIAQRVAAALGIRNVQTEIDSALLLEVTVVLGTDWAPRRF